MCKVNYSVLAMLIIKESVHCSLTPLAIIVVIALIVFLTKYRRAQCFASRKKDLPNICCSFCFSSFNKTNLIKLEIMNLFGNLHLSM